MKVLICTRYWNSSLGGGINSYLQGFYSALRHSAPYLDVHVAFMRGSDDTQRKISSGKITSVLDLIRVLKKTKPDIIHVHEDRGLLVAAAMYKKDNPQAKLVFTFHSEPDERNKSRILLFNMFERGPFKEALKSCDSITIVAKKLERSIESIYRLDLYKPALTYGGVTSKPFTQEDLQKFKSDFKLDGKHPIILMQAFTATKVKADGVRLVMSVMGELVKRYPNLVLLLTRNGKFVPELKETAERLNLSSNIVFTGDVSNPFIPLSLCDVYLHITYGDGLPMALVEAMSMGKIIIASNVGGIPEAVTDDYDSLLVSNNGGEIVSAITNVLDDAHLCDRISANVLKSYESKFNWDNNIKKIINIYSRAGEE